MADTSDQISWVWQLGKFCLRLGTTLVTLLLIGMLTGGAIGWTVSRAIGLLLGMVQ